MAHGDWCYKLNSDGEFTRYFPQQFFFSWLIFDETNGGRKPHRLADVGTFEKFIDRVDMSDCSDEFDFRIFDIENGKQLVCRRVYPSLKYELVDDSGNIIAVAYGTDH